MAASATTQWAERLQTGTLELFDLKTLEDLPIDELVHDLESAYPIRFLDRRVDSKCEIGLAQTARKRSGTLRLTGCLIVTSESGAITTLAAMTQLRTRPSRSKPDSLELITEGGFNLYHDPDGWRLKLLYESTVILTEQALRKRGWLFESLTNGRK